MGALQLVRSMSFVDGQRITEAVLTSGSLSLVKNESMNRNDWIFRNCSFFWLQTFDLPRILLLHLDAEVEFHGIEEVKCQEFLNRCFLLSLLVTMCRYILVVFGVNSK